MPKYALHCFQNKNKYKGFIFILYSTLPWPDTWHTEQWIVKFQIEQLSFVSDFFVIKQVLLRFWGMYALKFQFDISNDSKLDLMFLF